MKKIALVFSLLVLSVSAYSQAVIPCYTDEVQEALIQANPQLEAAYEEARQLIESARLEPSASNPEQVVRVIPVVVHVIYNNEFDNISKAQIEDAIAVLNEDFRRQNADASNTRAIFQAVAADAEVEFRLATIDPQGNCTEGITRTQSALSLNGNDNVKSLIAWDRTKYMNIWTVRTINLPNGPTTGTVLGYAYKPFPGQTFDVDGIVMRHDRMGRLGTAVGLGRTLTHEVGHYLGLDHTFNNGCFGGDGCADTPPAANPNYGCPLSINSCSNDSPNQPDQVENYMDYSDDGCMNMFSLDQKSKMVAVLTTANLRSNLVSPSNAQATGINVNPAPLCAPKAEFKVDLRTTCAGEPLQFTDLSWNGAPSSWSWSFPGGTPATSTQQNPVVTYAAAGNYPVTLTVTNATGSSTETKTQWVAVKPVPTPFVNSVVNDFETYPVPDLYWTSISTDANQFQTSNTVGFNSGKSLFLNNHAAAAGQVDEFFTPTIDIAWATDLSLSFDYAFARKNTSNTDQLRVLVSQDCGNSWTLRRTLGVSNLETANPRSAPFVPSGAGEWKNVSIPMFQFTNPANPIIIRFEFTSGGGNNLYIDNINLAASLSADEAANPLGITLYPNPTHGQVRIKASGTLDGATARLTDLSGRVLHAWPTLTNEGVLPTDDLPTGVYLLQVEKDGATSVHRLIKE